VASAYSFAGPLRGKAWDGQVVSGASRLNVGAAFSDSGVHLIEPTGSLPLTDVVVGCD
jgi:hypothetical protein